MTDSQAVPILTFDSVTYSYGDGADNVPADDTESTDNLRTARRALDAVTFSVLPGELVAVIGANGSGKSTLAKHINALLTPDSGRVLVLGFDTSDPENLMRIRSHAGMVFQNPDAQMVTSNVADEVAFGPENLGLPREDIALRVDEALDTVHMRDRASEDPAHLSGGQRQRVAIASVLAMRPDIIIFDEPDALLDPRARRGIRRVIHELHESGITILLITHSMNEAAHTERVIVMSAGQLMMDGTPDEVFIQKERLRELGLEVPYSVILAEALRARGIDLPDDIHTENLKEELCRLRSSR